MKQSPSWEANSFSATQEILRILWNLSVNYRIHKCPTPVPVLNQLDPVHTSTFHFLKINFNIILPYMPDIPTGLFPSGFPQKPRIASPLPHTLYMPHPPHFLDFITRTI
jgi:hypothetical protein